VNAFLAIVGDTWRQSRQQIVFMVMIGLLVIMAGIVVALPGRFEPVTRVAWNDGSGAFSEEGPDLPLERPRDLLLRDLDGDGDLDLAAACGAGEPSQVLWNDGSGAFEPGPELGGGDARAVAAGDLDGDGDLDLVLARADGPDAVWLNDGAGGFAADAELGDTESAAVALGDLDGDGDLDLVTANRRGPNPTWLNDGSGGFAAGPPAGGADTRGVFLVDVDADGRLDLVWANELESGIYVGDGSGGFTRRLAGEYGRVGAVADVDGDGSPDLLMADERSHRTRVWLNDGAGGYLSSVHFPAAQTLDLAVADVDGDGDLDVLNASDGAAFRRVLTNEIRRRAPRDPEDSGVSGGFLTQRGGEEQELLPDRGAGVSTLAAGDLDGDGDVDAVAGAWEPKFAWAWQDEPDEFLDSFWRQQYAAQRQAEAAHEDRELEPGAGMAYADDLAAEVTHLQRSLEVLIQFSVTAIYPVSMLLFIAACSAYFPLMVTSGAVDVVLARPVGRLRIFLGKYVGGLVLFAGVVLVTYLIVWAGIGLRTGHWHGRIFLAIPIQIFAAAVLYALLALVGLLTRSSVLAMVLGYAFYLLIDTAVDFLISFQMAGFLKDWPFLETLAKVLKHGFPNFGLLKGIAIDSVLYAPTMEWTPVFTASVWLVIALGLGYAKFRWTDY